MFLVNNNSKVIRIPFIMNTDDPLNFKRYTLKCEQCEHY